MTELERLSNYFNNEIEKDCYTISVNNLLDPHQSMLKIQQVMKSILMVPQELWEEDREAEWAPYMPAWFMASMNRYSIEEMMRIRNEWDFESWVAAVQDRAWEWWSCFVGENMVIVNLYTYSYPFNIQPFLFILYECCGRNADMHYSYP